MMNVCEFVKKEKKTRGVEKRKKKKEKNQNRLKTKSVHILAITWVHPIEKQEDCDVKVVVAAQNPRANEDGVKRR